MSKQRIRLWDLPTRLFHWLLALCVVAALVSGQLGGKLIELHSKVGLVIVGLLAFRLVWGFVGSTYARFSQFFPTTATIRAYRKGEWRGVGHNPMGALSVFGLILLLSVQVLSGLFANDDIAFVGPLYGLIGKSLSDRLTGVHELFSNAVIALVVLHVGAIAFYVRVRKENLVGPMLTGWKDSVTGESAKGGGLIALVIALLIAGAMAYLASGIWLPAPPPEVVETPHW